MKERILAKPCATDLDYVFAVKAEIAIFDNVIVLYKFIGDLMFFVTVSQDENELLMYTVLEAFHESVSLLLRYGDFYEIASKS